MDLPIASWRQIQHHDDGTWGSFEPTPEHRDRLTTAERDWANGTIYKCTSCDEEILVGRAPGHPPRR